MKFAQVASAVLIFLNVHDGGAETTGVAPTRGASEKRCRRAPQPLAAADGGGVRAAAANADAFNLDVLSGREHSF